MKTKLYGKALATLGVAAALSACGSGNSDDGDGNTGDTGSVLYNITSQVTGPGALSPSTHQMDSTETLSMQVTADENAELQSISGCNGSLNTSQSQYTISGLSADCSVQAVFTATDTGSVGNGTSITVGRSHMTFAAFTIDDDVSPLDIPISGTNPDGQSGSFEADFSGLNDDTWVLIKASSGMQLDPQYSGEYHAGYNTPDAELFALAQVRDWKSGASISALSDVVWRLTSNWVGQLNAEEFELRLNRVVEALGVSDKWTKETIYQWSMNDRRNLEESQVARISGSQFSVNGALILDDKPSTGYQHFIDAKTNNVEMQRYASVIAGPTISAGFSGTGESYARINFETFGPSQTESSLNGLTLGVDEHSGSAVVERNLKSHSITAIEDPAKGIVLTRWDNCPSVTNRLTCEFTGMQARDILAIFDYDYALYADGFEEIEGHVDVDWLNDDTLLFKEESLLPNDIQALENLVNGGFLGLYHPEIPLMTEVLSSEQMPGGDWSVQIQDVPIDDIFLEGSLYPVELDSYFELDDGTGNISKVSLQGLSVDNPVSSDDKYISVQILYDGTVILKANKYGFDADLRGRLDVHGRDSRFRIGRWFSSANIDLILGTEIDLSGSLGYQLSSELDSKDTNLGLTFHRTFLLGKFLITQRTEIKPDLTIKTVIDTGGLGIELGAGFSQRVGVSLTMGGDDSFQVRPVLSSNSKSQHAALNTGVDSFEYIEASTSSRTGLATILSGGLYGAQFISATTSGGLEANISSRYSTTRDIEGYCNPVDFGINTYLSSVTNFGLSLIVDDIFKTCRFCRRFIDRTKVHDLEIPLYEQTWDILARTGDDFLDATNRCEKEGMEVRLNIPERIEFTTRNHPDNAYSWNWVFDTLMRLPGGEWRFDDDFYRQLESQGYDFENAVTVKNVSSDRELPVSTIFEVNYTEDNTYDPRDGFRPLEIIPSEGLNFVRNGPENPYIFEPGNEENVSYRIRDGLSSGGVSEYFNGRTYEYLFTFENETPDSEQKESVHFTMSHVEPPQLDAKKTFRHRRSSTSQRERIDFALQLNLPEWLEGDERFTSLVHDVEVEVRVNGQKTNDERAFTVEFSEGLPLIKGYVTRPRDGLSDDVQLIVRHGWDYQRQVHIFERTITYPSCPKDESDRYDCQPIYDGEWYTTQYFPPR